jgi:3-isopropylmalate/(R)-2-methylmalate dehydratase small subunit
VSAFDLQSRVALLLRDHIDTDQIIPARFLTTTTKVGLGEKLFHDWRFDAEGTPRSEFVLERADPATTRILLVGDDFGCGSSREHAPWALLDWGLRAILARSFADIFRNNALQNGLLPIELEEGPHARLIAQLESEPGAQVTVSLEASAVTLPDGEKVPFTIDPFQRHLLLEGIDALDFLRSFGPATEVYEAERAG